MPSSAWANHRSAAITRSASSALIPASSAAPTATVSRTAASSNAREPGVARIGPIGPRVSEVIPASGASMANFIQISRWMFGERVASMPAALARRVEGARARALRAVAFGKLQLGKTADLLDDAGLERYASQCARRPAPRSRLPRSGPTRSALSTPFWKVNTAAPLAIRCLMVSAAASVSPILTAKMMASAAAISRASPTTLHGLQVQFADLAVEAQAHCRASPPGARRAQRTSRRCRPLPAVRRNSRRPRRGPSP